MENETVITRWDGIKGRHVTKFGLLDSEIRKQIKNIADTGRICYHTTRKGRGLASGHDIAETYTWSSKN